MTLQINPCNSNRSYNLNDLLSKKLVASSLSFSVCIASGLKVAAVSSTLAKVSLVSLSALSGLASILLAVMHICGIASQRHWQLRQDSYRNIELQNQLNQSAQ
jgi:hypothetical protein